MTKLLGSWDPMILGVLDCLGVELPLGVVGLTAEFVPIVCSGPGPDRPCVPLKRVSVSPTDAVGGTAACALESIIYKNPSIHPYKQVNHLR